MIAILWYVFNFFHIIITLSLIQNIQFLFIYNTDDKDQKKVNPDKLRHGVQEFESENEKELLYMFLAKYVRKTHADSEIKREKKVTINHRCHHQPPGSFFF